MRRISMCVDGFVLGLCCFTTDYGVRAHSKGKICGTCHREMFQRSHLDKAFLLLFRRKGGCSGHEIIDDPCGEQAEADHERGAGSTSTRVHTWKLKKKLKGHPVMDQSILPDLFLTSPFLHNSNSLMTRIP